MQCSSQELGNVCVGQCGNALISVAAIPDSSPARTQTPKNENTLGGGAIAAIVVSVVVVLAAIAAVIVFIVVRRSREDPKAGTDDTTSGTALGVL